MDEAPRRCPGCCGGCRNVYAMRDALNTLHAGSWRAQANALLSEQGFHCDAYAWVQHVYVPNGQYGGTMQRHEHLVVRVFDSRDAMSPHGGGDVGCTTVPGAGLVPEAKPDAHFVPLAASG